MTGNEKKILLLSPCWYLFIVVSGNNYIPKGINGNTLYCQIPLVTIPFLDFIMIQ